MRAHLMLLSMAIIFANAALSLEPITPTLTPYARISRPHVRGHLLVRVEPTHAASLKETARIIGAERTESFDLVPGLNLYEFDESLSVEEVRRQFLKNTQVLYAEPDYIYRVAALPNDPQFSKQYALQNNGDTGGIFDADINAPEMWEIEKGSENIVIATIDTGIDYRHPDLADNLWINPGEIANNGKDDDNNGYIDDLYGINAIKNSGDPLDDNVHGTHVAGTIGARGDNNIGVAGVAQKVKIVSCKFLSGSGSGGISDALKCMDYIAALKSRSQNRVNIVATNNSWGGGSYSQAFYDAIKAHEKLDILFIAAAGNSSENNDVVDRYPCNYQLPNVISVAATDNKDQLAVFSSYGKNKVHVAAPGAKILSTTLNNGYGELSGTSMATPHVSGLVAIIASHYPSYNYQKKKNLVMSSGQVLRSTQNITISGRRIRGADSGGVGALTCRNQILSKRLKPELKSVNINLGSSLFLSATAINCAENLTSLKIYDQNNQQVTLQDNGQQGDLIAGDGILSLTWTPSSAGTYMLDFGTNDIVTVVVSGQTPPTQPPQDPPARGNYRIDDSVAYEYENIQGEALRAGDDTIHWLKIPFALHFANDEVGFENLYVSSNGTISFTSTSELDANNRSLPVPSKKNFLAPFWDDLVPAIKGSDIYASVVGEKPHRRVIIEWYKFRHFGALAQGTFQTVLYEDSPNIRINYKNTNFGTPQFNNGKSATVGVQIDRDKVAQYSYNQSNIPSQKSLLFRME